MLFADMQARIADVSGPGDKGYGKKAEQQLRFRIGVVIPRDIGRHAKILWDSPVRDGEINKSRSNDPQHNGQHD